jgi:hypothetical protein
MPDIITWVSANWGMVIQIYLSVVGLASLIVKITPTLKDDDALKGFIKFVGKWIAVDKYSPPKTDA